MSEETFSASVNQSENRRELQQEIFGTITEEPIALSTPITGESFDVLEDRRGSSGLKVVPSLLGESRLNKKDEERGGGGGGGGERNKKNSLFALSTCFDIAIEIDDYDCFSCEWDRKYTVKDGSEGHLMFQAIEEYKICPFFINLRNIIVRDYLNHAPLARICYKEKSFFLGRFNMAIYSPPDLLIGRIEELTRICSCSKEFLIRNSDGDNLFFVDINRKFCTTKFMIVSADESRTEIAKIVEMKKRFISLTFMSKLNITSKIILLGFFIGLIHRKYSQPMINDE